MSPDVTATVYLAALKESLLAARPRTLARAPLERHAARLIASRPAVDLTHFAPAGVFQAHVPEPRGRHAWSLHAPDQFILQSLIATRGIRTAFEIGTFNGGTTRVIAEALPQDGRVFTLDLPPAAFDATQSPQAFEGSQVGREYRDSPAVAKITQLLHDSATFDPSPYAGTCDLVLVDGAHDHEHGVADTRTAFTLLAPGGIIVWDDFQPYWHGLIRGIFEAAGPRVPRRLAGSNLGVWTADLPD